MNLFRNLRAGHKARNDSPSYDDYKPSKRDGIPADYNQHPLWCHSLGHDGPCRASTAATGAGGMRFTVAVTYDWTAEDPRPVMVVEVGGRTVRLDADEAAPVFGLAGSWLAPMNLPHLRPSESEPQS